MIVLHSEAEFRGARAVVALGMFDGVHIGHQKLIREAVALSKELNAEAVVCTFDRHPLSVVAPERAPEPVLPLEENLKKFEALGADIAIVRPFTREFAAMEPESYIQMLKEQLRVAAIVAGENYTFGDRGRGNAALIRALSEKYGYWAEIVPPVMIGNRVASSTLVRELRREGKMEAANQLLRIQ